MNYAGRLHNLVIMLFVKLHRLGIVLARMPFKSRSMLLSDTKLWIAGTKKPPGKVA